MQRCKALQGMRQEIRRLTAPPTAAALEKARERAKNSPLFESKGIMRS